MTNITPKIALFCDEAGKDSDQFLAVGGLIVAHSDVQWIRREFQRRKHELHIPGEAKWSLTTKGKLEKFRSLVNWTFNLIEQRELGFHCILVDFMRFDHDLRSDGGRGESLKRMYFQLILHRLLKKYGRQYDCYALIDKCNELDGFTRFKDVLNRKASDKGYCDQVLRAVEFRDSEAEPLLQLNDLILGAICAHKNRRFDEPGAGQPKANLAGYVLGKTSLTSYDHDTPLASDGFSIWNLKSEHMRGGVKA